MKKFLVLGLLGLSVNALATEIETIEIVKPMIALHEATIAGDDGFGNRSGALSEAKLTGSFQSTFTSKTACVAWANSSIATLEQSKKIVFSASCSNKDLAPLYLDAGHFVGNVAYL